MSITGEEPVVADPAAAADVVADVADGNGAAAPEIKPKGRVKKPNRPDDESYKQVVDALQQTINTNKKRVEDIRQKLEDRRAGRSKGSGEQQGLKSQLAELRTQFQAVLKRKQALRDQLEAASKTRDAVKSSLKDLKASMKFTTVEQIDEAIAEMEMRMQHSSLTLNEEKKVLEDIRTLRKSRSAVGQYSVKLEALAQDDSSRGEISASLKSLDEELSTIRAQEDVLRAELTVLREKEAAAGSDYPALLQEREECRELCKQAYEKIKDLRAEHDAEWQRFKDDERAWRAQQAEDRAARDVEWQKEKAARDAERAARFAENAPEPFDKEVTTCEQLAAYLARFAPSEAAAGPAVPTVEVAHVDGMKVFKRAEVEEDSAAWVTGTGGKKGKGKGRKGAGDKSVSAAPERLVHSLDMLGAFATLSLAVPTSAAAVPALLEEVAAKKEVYLQKRAEVKAKGGDAAAAAEPAAAAPAPANGTSDGAGSSREKKPRAAGEKPKKAAPALRLDDAASWPAVGVAAGAAPAAEEEVAADAEDTAEAAPADPAPAAVEDAAEEEAPLADKGDAAAGVSVGLTVGPEEGDGISLAISHGEE